MSVTQVDVLLVGGGVMSATLGTLLRQMDPALRILMVERLDQIACESTDGWNNAGTGHAGYCELNYTPQGADGRIAVDRALHINAAFETSLQFWAALVAQGTLPAPRAFIRPVPHISFVRNEEDRAFLCRRHALLSAHPLFHGMHYSEDRDQIAAWAPLIMAGRDPAQAVAATRSDRGTDVDFGALTRHLVEALQQQANFSVWLGHAVQRLMRQSNGAWRVTLRPRGGATRQVEAGFVFLGAGGGTLPLLQYSGIPEARGYGGFPVSGHWLVCDNPKTMAAHQVKVYGKPAQGAPPMAAPHLDSRYIAGQPALLFGPYAGFSPRFLKQGSLLDLPASVRIGNLGALLGAGAHNLGLLRYLVGEAFSTRQARINTLRAFYPALRSEEWRLQAAGQRVQVIKRCVRHGGRLEFGTEIVVGADGTLAALLGASPGASTSVRAMLDVLERCFAERLRQPAWQERLRQLIPAYGVSLLDDAALLESVRAHSQSVLGLR